MHVQGLDLKFDTSLDNLYSYLPHGKSLRLITSIDSVDNKELTARAFFGKIPSCLNKDQSSYLFSGIEYIAQAAALFQVIIRLSKDTHQSRNNLGYLIAIRNIEIVADRPNTLKNEDEIKVSISSSDKIGNVYQVRGNISNMLHEKILDAKITLYEVPHV